LGALNGGEIELHVGRLVLDEMSPAQQRRVAATLTAEFERLVAEHGAPAGWEQGAEIDLPAHSVTVAHGSGPEAIGAAVARSVWGRVGGGEESGISEQPVQGGVR
jgi:hypothetical protein